MSLWRFNRRDPRVQAALGVDCRICGVGAGFDCMALDRRPLVLTSGIVHMWRVPKRVLLPEGGNVTDDDA